jgi:hypothetical protein
MIVEMRTYIFHPGGAPKFFKLYDGAPRELQAETLGNLIGYFSSEIGELNKTVHLWGYGSLDERQRRRALLAARPEWQQFLAQILPLLVSQTSEILLPTAFSPIR